MLCQEVGARLLLSTAGRSFLARHEPIGLIIRFSCPALSLDFLRIEPALDFSGIKS